MSDVYVTPETGLNVVGFGIATPAGLPAGQSIVQGFGPRDQNGNYQYFNTDGSVKIPAIGGAFVALPAATTNGAALTSGPTGVEITLPPGTSVTYTIAAAQPTSAPTLVRTIANSPAATSYIVDQVNLATGTAVYLTAVGSTGTPFYRSI